VINNIILTEADAGHEDTNFDGEKEREEEGRTLVLALALAGSKRNATTGMGPTQDPAEQERGGTGCTLQHRPQTEPTQSDTHGGGAPSED